MQSVKLPLAWLPAGQASQTFRPSTGATEFGMTTLALGQVTQSDLSEVGTLPAGLQHPEARHGICQMNSCRLRVESK
jgi:hypothetical protein